ncbi:MAG: tetratricopeptide repeat protein [Candidatus Omnitrophica bacterium]|nr:tetratricopeptide repeat protein [Candidatus Omnitrophota bacterium]
MSQCAALSDEDFVRFQEFFVNETGLYFDNSKDQSLISALSERLTKKGHSSYKEYYNYLKYHPESRFELREILTLLTTGETYFFRNIAQFEVLMQDVLPEIIKRKKPTADRSIRVWSAGCSRGDEAYSIMIAIMEILPDYRDWNISILGTDINRDVLAVAREAVYTPKDLGELPAEFVERYFHRKRADYILNSDVKPPVRFVYHNLCKDQFSQDGMCGIDIVFCRNVTIYFNPDTTRALMGRFYNALADGGYMFLGHSETLWQINHQFRTIEYPHTFIYKKDLGAVVPEPSPAQVSLPVFSFDEKIFGSSGLSSFRPAGAPGTADNFSPSGAAVPSVEEVFFMDSQTEAYVNEAGDNYRGRKYAEAFVCLEKALARNAGHPRANLLKAVILADQAKYDEAIAVLSALVQKDNLNEEATFLLALLYAKAGLAVKAEAMFRRIIFLAADEPLAYFHLGNILAARQLPPRAALEFRNAIRLLEKRPANEPVKFGDDLSSGALLQACKRNLLSLSLKSHGKDG